MKSRLALVAMLVVAAAPLAAQGGGGAPGGGRGMGGRGMNIEAMTALYTLTPEQVTKADALIKAYQESTRPLQQYMMAQRQGGGEVNADSMKKSTDLRTKFNADIKALLTGDQVKKWDSVQAAQAARMGGRGPGGL